MKREPIHQISRKGLTVWHLYGVFQTAIVAILAGVVCWGIYYFNWPIVMYYFVGVIVALSAVFFIYIFPKIRWDHWRYEVRDHEIEIQQGLFVVKRTLIPMVRVQHVDTIQGPILKKYDLGNISISTAATIHTIPALVMKEADVVRARISQLARVAEDDV